MKKKKRYRSKRRASLKCVAFWFFGGKKSIVFLLLLFFVSLVCVVLFYFERIELELIFFNSSTKFQSFVSNDFRKQKKRNANFKRNFFYNSQTNFSFSSLCFFAYKRKRDVDFRLLVYISKSAFLFLSTFYFLLSTFYFLPFSFSFTQNNANFVSKFHFSCFLLLAKVEFLGSIRKLWVTLGKTRQQVRVKNQNRYTNTQPVVSRTLI